MNYYKKNESYIASDLTLDLEAATQAEFEAWLAKNKKSNDLKAMLEDIDTKSARAIRAILSNTATKEDKDYLAQLEMRAISLRQQLKDL